MLVGRCKTTASLTLSTLFRSKQRIPFLQRADFGIHGKLQDEATTKKRQQKNMMESLSEVDMEIVKRHTLACKHKRDSYIEPETGYVVLSEYYHKNRGTCCGNQCRHCPFGHENVPKHLRTSRFNSLFYK